MWKYQSISVGFDSASSYSKNNCACYDAVHTLHVRGGTELKDGLEKLYFPINTGPLALLL